MDDPNAAVHSWEVADVPVMWPSPLRAGVFRVQGTATTSDGQRRPWSTILRIATCPPEGRFGSHEGDWRYWRREERLVQAGYLQVLPAGFTTPSYYRIDEQADGQVWLWMEDLGDTRGDPWPQQRLALTGRHLGRFHATYAEGAGVRPLPDEPWLPQDWLRQWIARVAVFERLGGPILADDAAWTHPLVRQVFPEPVRARVYQIWQDHQSLLAGLDRLPRTLCHGDFWCPNLFARTDSAGRAETAVIDWELANVGPIGADLGQFVVATIYDLRTDALDRASSLAYADDALAQYVTGLRDVAGESLAYGDERLVQLARFGCAAHAAVHWGWVYVDWAVRSILDPQRTAQVEAEYGRPIEEVAHHRAAAVYASLDLADQARALLPSVT